LTFLNRRKIGAKTGEKTRGEKTGDAIHIYPIFLLIESMVRKYGKYGDNSPIYYLFTQFFMAMKVGTIPKIRAQNRAQKNISRQFLSRRKDEKAKEAYKPISQPKNESKKVHLLLSSK